jgi:hypothetical protein
VGLETIKEMKIMKFLTFSVASVLSLSAMAMGPDEYKSYIVRSPDEPMLMMGLERTESDLEEGEEMRQQIKENGYYSTYSENAASLIAFKNKKAVAIAEKDSDPYFKNLRLSPSEFQMTFPFVGISSVDEEHLLGFAPGGSLDEGHWTGVVEYFNDDHFGTCKLMVFDMPSWNGQAIYDSTYTTYDINVKPTTRSAEGSDESGFIYETSWTGKRYEKQLECANNKPFDKQILEDLVRYAKKIDNDLPDTP